MKKLVLSLFAFSALNANAQNSITIQNSDVTINEGESVNITTTAVFPATYPGTSSLTTVGTQIPDGDAVTGLSSTTIITSSLNASQLESITVNINAEWNADIDLYLIAPDGSQIELSTDNGGSGDNYENCTFTNYPGNYPITLASSSFPISGLYSPEESFLNLTGPANGTWTLQVFDDSGADYSFLMDWTLTLPGGTNEISYSWSPATGLDDATSANPVATPTQTTTYIVTATDLSGAAAVTDQITITVNSTAGIEQNSFSNIQIYPNPTNGLVNISNIPAGTVIKVLDASGRVVVTQISDANATSIDLSNQEDGVYFVSFQNTIGASVTKKLIVRK